MTESDANETPAPQGTDEAPEGTATTPAEPAEAAASEDAPPAKKTARKTAAKKTAKKATSRRTTRKTAEAAPAPIESDAESAPESSGESGAESGAESADSGAAAADSASAQAPDAATEPTQAAAEESRPRKKAAARRPRKSAAAAEPSADEAVSPASDAVSPTESESTESQSGPAAPPVLFQPPETKPAPARRTRKKAEPTPSEVTADDEQTEQASESTPTEEPTKPAGRKRSRKQAEKQRDKQAESETDGGDRAPDTDKRGEKDKGTKEGDPQRGEAPGDKADNKPGDKTGDKAGDKAGDKDEKQDDQGSDAESGDAGESEGGRRRRRRGGRRRRKGGGDNGQDASDDSDDNDDDSDEDESAEGDEGGSRRRRTRNRQPKSPEDEITAVTGSTRLEAKKQRRREGREAGRRRAPIVSEAEFLARREAVDRVMVIRQKADLTQIAVLEDKVLVEHYVARESQTSLIGNIYLGRVQNVLPSMEAAFVDIGKGRNAVLYAGEVNWKALGHKDGQPRKIESVLSSGQTVLVQVTKDPVGHKGARLTGQISLPGRFLVYVPDGTTSGISRKLPDTERNRLKALLKEIVPDSAGVIVRTAAEGASEEELTHDVERLTARWADIEKKVQAGKAPELLYGEPDLTLKVVRDLFTEDFGKLVVQGDDAWDLVDGYVSHVAPDLRDRLERFEPEQVGSDDGSQNGQPRDVFTAYRIDEQIAKGLDRKVWLPSGGSLIIDRTEAMTVVDVNTGKFTGSGGNLEETVTKNNLEAAEEIVRQLRLRDIGGIIVVDFIDMVLESNRDLVLRRLVECLGRDRTRHQVAEVTSLGLVQMTRKRIGTGLLEAFAEECQHCKGRGVVIHDHPIEPSQKVSDEPRGRRGRGGRGRGRSGDSGSGGNGGRNHGAPAPSASPSPKDLAGTRPPVEREPQADEPVEQQSGAAASESVPAAPAAVEVTGQRNAPVDQPEQPPASGPETRSEPESRTRPEVESGPESGAEAPGPVDTAPKVVVTRRRRAARPAGPPSAQDETTISTDGQDRPEQANGDGAATGAGSEHHDAGSAGRADDAEGPEGEHGSEGSLLHVPVKKKGSRKR